MPDLIDRGTVLDRLDLAEHDAEERDWRSGANEIARLRAFVTALPPAADPRDEAIRALVEAVDRLNAACDAMWNDHNRVQNFRIREAHMKAISEAQQQLPAALAKAKEAEK